MNEPRQALADARLYLVCDALSDHFLERAIRGGVEIVQLRMKSASDEDIVAAGRRFSAVCSANGVVLILNDRPDLVPATGADGVHVGQDDVPVADARRLVGVTRIVGLSTHTPEQIDAAARDPDIDYIGVGPVQATPTKPGRPAVGLELVGYAAAHAATPFFAIGGLNRDNAASVRAAGGRRIAVVRALTEAEDPEQAARDLRSAIDSELGVGAAR
ncbi:MAG TPA: thiamine phosphate synthase [Solirubrobacteraceae bacterium]